MPKNLKQIFPISTFMCLWANYIFPRWVWLSSWRKYVERSWEYINRSQTHDSWNWGWGRTIPRKGIHKGDFRCSVVCGPEPEVLSDPLLFIFRCVHLHIGGGHLFQNIQCHLSIDVSIRVDWIRSPACQEGLLHPLSSASRVTGHVRRQMAAQTLLCRGAPAAGLL